MTATSWPGVDDGEAPRTPPAWIFLATSAAIAAWAGGLIFGFATGNGELIGGMVIAPVLTVIVSGIASRYARVDRDDAIARLVTGAWAVKFLGTIARYEVDYRIYHGSDATEYNKWGHYLSGQFRQGNFHVTLGNDVSGTKFMRLLTGILYTVTPRSQFSGYLIFSFFGFLGLLLFWRAFKLAVPDGNPLRYAKLVLLLPSLVYWPSAIGKEAWMILALGLCSYGAAAFLTRRFVASVVTLALGFAGVFAVRPHLGLIVFAGLACALLLRRNRSGSPFGTWVAIIALVFVGMLVVKENKKFFGTETFDVGTVQQQLQSASSRTSTGGSEFTPVSGTNPVTFPLALVTVIYRPFPGEVGSATGLVTGLESVAMIGITLASRKSIRRILKAFREVPYISYCVGYTIVFVMAFSSFSNFGILARERTMMLPVFLALLCLVRPNTETDRPALELERESW